MVAVEQGVRRAVQQLASASDAAPVVRRLTDVQMATLSAIRDAGHLVRVKITPGAATTILCAFAEEDEQEWEPMIADHPEKDATGADIPALLRVYEAHIVLVRME